jgi:catechol 2,3-dioxygenase-like lactoylglutathione lyase family enzyme
MKIEFVAGFASIVAEPARAQRFYRDAMGLPLKTNSGNPD